ncbi:MAG: hypothetical protein LBB66_06035 [Desulfovibrio sp.]|jgi:hypothetical protein|nr:hypothetical protein [Desulfovibrio sp.]
MPAALRACAFMFIPAACWQVWLSPDIPNYHFQHAFMYVVLLLLCLAWAAGIWSPEDMWTRRKRLLPWLGALLALQGLAAFMNDGGLACITTPAKLLIQLATLLPILEACRVLTGRATLHNLLFSGAVLSLAIICWQAAWQGFYIIFRITGFDFAAYISKSYLSHTAPWLEARWPDALNGYFYARGSYTLTTPWRINGIFEEASALAANTGVFFVPLGFALSVLAGKARLAGQAVLGASLLLMIGSISLTGLLLAAPALLFFFAALRRKRDGKGRKASLAALALLLLAAGAIVLSPPMQIRLNLAAHNAEPPRAVITLVALDTALEHPLLGVGRGNFPARALQHSRFMAALERERELRDWKEAGLVPQLAMLPIFAAEYGLPVSLVCLLLVARFWRKLRAAPPFEENARQRFIAALLSAWMVMAFCAGWGAIDPRNPLFILPLFFIIAYTELKE